jgi:hypothetical protein
MAGQEMYFRQRVAIDSRARRIGCTDFCRNISLADTFAKQNHRPIVLQVVQLGLGWN